MHNFRLFIYFIEAIAFGLHRIPFSLNVLRYAPKWRLEKWEEPPYPKFKFHSEMMPNFLGIIARGQLKDKVFSRKIVANFGFLLEKWGNFISKCLLLNLGIFMLRV